MLHVRHKIQTHGEPTMKTTLSTKFNATAILLAFIVSALGAISWSVDLTQAAAAPSATAPAPAKFHAFMLAIVGPAAAPIWDGGYAAKLTDQDWERIRQAAINLTASVSTISSGGTVAAEQARAKSAVWQEWTKKLSEPRQQPRTRPTVGLSPRWRLRATTLSKSAKVATWRSILPPNRSSFA